MGLFEETCKKITPKDAAIGDAVQAVWDRATPYGSFGKLVDMVKQYAMVARQPSPSIPKHCMIIAAADHGVAEMGVSAYPIDVTVGMTQNYLIPKGAGANALGNYCGTDMEVVDVGIKADMNWVPGLRHNKIRMGTRNFLKEPAMTKEEAIQAMEVGIALVNEKVAEGYNVFLVGEMGIANTTASAVMTAKFAGITAEQATGRGTNISDERLKVKQKVVHDALEKYADIDKNDGLGILHSVGGLEFACITGIILGAAAAHAMVIIDGFNTTACALVAHSLVPESMDYVMASHLSAEKAHNRALNTLGLEAYVNLGLCLGEASGGSIQMGMLDLAVRMYQELEGGHQA